MPHHRQLKIRHLVNALGTLPLWGIPVEVRLPHSVTYPREQSLKIH